MSCLICCNKPILTGLFDLTLLPSHVDVQYLISAFTVSQCKNKVYFYYQYKKILTFSLFSYFQTNFKFEITLFLFLLTSLSNFILYLFFTSQLQIFFLLLNHGFFLIKYTWYLSVILRSVVAHTIDVSWDKVTILNSKLILFLLRTPQMMKISPECMIDTIASVPQFYI
jgi:hypothetical protein